jgi:hypothetical protein
VAAVPVPVLGSIVDTTLGVNPVGILVPTSAPAFTSFKDQLITLLHIPVALTNRQPSDLRASYQKYLAYLDACSTMERMVLAKTWPGKKPSITDIIECFISKTFWHDYYKPSFTKLSSFPVMVKWLEGGDDGPTALVAWGTEKPVYVFRDLIEFVGNGGQLKGDNEKGKGEGKGLGKKAAGSTGKKVVKKAKRKVAVEKEEASPKANKKCRVS